MKKIKRLILTLKESERAFKRRSLHEAFAISEKNYRLWILCNGTAVKEIPSTSTSEDIIRILGEVRRAASEYEL